jgi:hypothetical protein
MTIGTKPHFLDMELHSTRIIDRHKDSHGRWRDLTPVVDFTTGSSGFVIAIETGNRMVQPKRSPLQIDDHEGDVVGLTWARVLQGPGEHALQQVLGECFSR